MRPQFYGGCGQGRSPIVEVRARRIGAQRAFVLEALEKRQLLSAAAPLPADMIGTFDGTARIAFSPQAFHKNGADSVTLSINSEGEDGSVAGTINDQFAGMLSVTGTVNGRHLTASLTGSGISGNLTGHLRSDGTVLAGRVTMLMGSGSSAIGRRGSFVLTQPRGALGLFRHYAGRGHGVFLADLSAQARPTRTNHRIALAIMGQARDGTATGQLDGFQFSGPVIGQIAGRTFTFHFDSRFVAGAADSSISGTISSDGRVLSGRYNIEFGTYIRTDRGSFKLRPAAG